MAAEITFTVPRDLWHSLNRYPTKGVQVNRLRQGIHGLVRTALFMGGLSGTVQTPVDVIWTVCYPAGTTKEHGDPVNASPVTKALLDGLVHAKTLPEDGPDVVLREIFQRGPNLPRRDSPHQITLHLSHPTTHKESFL